MSSDSSSSEDDFEAVDDTPTLTSANAAKNEEFDDDDIFSDVFSTSENVSKLDTIIKSRKVPENEKEKDDNMTSKVC